MSDGKSPERKSSWAPRLSAHAADGPQIPMPGFVAIGLVLVCAVIQVVLFLLSIKTVLEPPHLLTILNTVFITGLMMVVAVISARSYLLGLSAALAPMGAGLFAFSLCSFIAAIAFGRGDPNLGVALHNVGLLACAIGTLIGALHLSSSNTAYAGSWFQLFVWYAAAALLVALTVLLEATNLFPIFINEQTLTPTPLRQLILAITAAIYLFNAIAIGRVAYESRLPFLAWFALGTALLALGALGLLGMKTVGTPLNWAARSTQYLAGIYLLIAVITAMRQCQRWVIPLNTLRETHDRYVSLVDNFPDAIFVHSDERFVFANSSAARLLGAQSSHDLIGRSITEIIPPHELHAVRSRIERSFAVNQPSPLREMPLQRFDGKIIYAEIIGAPVQYNGKPAVQVVMRDVTARRHEEQERRAADIRLRRVLDNLFAFVGLLDTNGILLEANRAPLAAAGIDIKDVAGKHFADTFWWAYDTDVQQQIRNAIARAAQGETVRFDIHARMAGGVLMPIDFQIGPIHDDSGRIVNLVPSAVNITERVEANNALRAAATTADLARAEAERANHAKDQFIAALSHELRTPLTPIMAIAGTLKNDPRLPGDVRADLATILRNVELETHLVGDLLDVSRVLSGKMHLLKRTVDAALVLREAAAIVGTDFDAMQQRLALEITGAPFVVEADPARLQQVFWNLLRNAGKFSPARSTITLRATRIDGEKLHVDVIDEGAGISPALLPRLFTPFVQGDAREGGLGLGLAIAKGIVTLHGGTITAHSDGPGRGATFSITLPLSSTQAIPDNAAPARPIVAAPSRRLRILLVEDHEDTARLMSRMLRADGHSVTHAGSVAAAITCAHAQYFDLLVSDLGLPDGTGHDMLLMLRSAGCSVHAIALSGYGSPADLERSRAVGFREHLTKPVNIDLLQQTINRIAGEIAPPAD